MSHAVEGWVYLITNPAMSGLVKIGYSMKDPQLRAKELNNTGAPFAYEVIYCVLVESPRVVEQELHTVFKSSNQGKEWFAIDAKSVITRIRRYGQRILRERVFKAELNDLVSVSEENGFGAEGLVKSIQQQLVTLNRKHDELVDKKINAQLIFNSVKSEVEALHQAGLRAGHDDPDALTNRLLSLRDVALSRKLEVQKIEIETSNLRKEIKSLKRKLASHKPGELTKNSDGYSFSYRL